MASLEEILKDAKVRRAERTAQAHLDQKVPGSLGLGVRYGPLEFEDLNPLLDEITAADGDSAKIAEANTTIVLTAARGVYAETDDGKRVGLDPAKPDAFPRIDRKFANEILGISGDVDARLAARELLGGYGIMRHSNAVIEFSMSSGVAADAEALGK